MKFRRSVPIGYLYLFIMILFSVWTVFPFFWALITSFKTQIDSIGTGFIPFLQFKPTLYAWKEILAARGVLTLSSLVNSVIIASLSALLCLAVGSLAGFAMARYGFRNLGNWIVSLRMFPPVVVVVPIFIMMQRLRLLDTKAAMILVHTFINLPLAVWLLQDFFRGVPEAVEEAALVDGCSRLRVLVRITLPLSLPGLVSVFVLCFIFSWGEFLYASVITYSNASLTLPFMVAGALSQKGLEFPKAFALTILTVIPPMILGTLLSKHLIRGMTLGAVKG